MTGPTDFDIFVCYYEDGSADYAESIRKIWIERGY